MTTESNSKTCSKCKASKSFSEFHNFKASKDGKRSACKACEKKWYEDNKVREIERAKKRYISKKEDILRYGAEHRLKNKERYKQSARRASFNRRNNCLNVQIKHNLSSQLGLALKKQNATKNSRIVQLLGCSIEEFQAYIGAQFSEGMSWANYGEWHLDHIKPCAAFNLTQELEVRKCFHHSNYQPLWSKDNIRKSSVYGGVKYKHTTY